MSTTTNTYRIRDFLLDTFLVFLTGGVWFLWIFVREMRRPHTA